MPSAAAAHLPAIRCAALPSAISRQEVALHNRTKHQRHAVPSLLLLLLLLYLFYIPPLPLLISSPISSYHHHHHHHNPPPSAPRHSLLAPSPFPVFSPSPFTSSLFLSSLSPTLPSLPQSLNTAKKVFEMHNLKKNKTT